MLSNWMVRFETAHQVRPYMFIYSALQFPDDLWNPRFDGWIHRSTPYAGLLHYLVIVRPTVVVCNRVPLVPVMVNVYVPVGVRRRLVETVRVDAG